MGNLLLLGNFQSRTDLIASLQGWRTFLCHSQESFLQHSHQFKPAAIVVAAPQWGPALNHFTEEAEKRRGKQRWLFSMGSLAVSPQGLEHLLVSAPLATGDGGKIQHWLLGRNLKERRSHRLSCRGGFRLKDSDYSRQPLGRKYYGEIRDLSAQGARLVLPKPLPASVNEYFEISLRDAQGQIRSYHAQIRWQKPHSEGHSEIGVQLMAEASP